MEREIDFLLYGNQFKKLYEKEILRLRDSYDLKKIDIDILYYLYHSGNHNTSKDIKELNSFNKGHISQSVCHLHDQHLVECIQDEYDRRCIHLCLTKEALDVVRQIDEIHGRIYSIIFDGITEDEKKELIFIAHKIRENIENALGE